MKDHTEQQTVNQLQKSAKYANCSEPPAASYKGSPGIRNSATTNSVTTKTNDRPSPKQTKTDHLSMYLNMFKTITDQITVTA